MRCLRMANEALDARRRNGGSGWLTKEMEVIKKHLNDHYWGKCCIGVTSLTKSRIRIRISLLCRLGNGITNYVNRVGVSGWMDGLTTDDYHFVTAGANN